MTTPECRWGHHALCNGGGTTLTGLFCRCLCHRASAAVRRLPGGPGPMTSETYGAVATPFDEGRTPVRAKGGHEL